MICDKCTLEMDEDDDKVLELKFREGLTLFFHWKCWLLCVAWSLKMVASDSDFV